MNKFNRLKSAIISGAVAMSALAAPLSAVSPSLTANAADGDNYAKLLQYSLYLYDANMCGDMSDCGISWRGNCHMNDDVVGGFHDAGDHVWFGQPEGYTASTLGWAYYEFKDAFEATGQGAHLKVITDHFADFMRKATKLNGNTVSQVLIEKGEGGVDHSYWGAPETQGNRGRMLWVSGGAANVTAEYAAALAANYVNFGNPDDLKYAKALYDFSKKDTGCYTCEFYDSHWTGSADEIAWAAGWLYLATKDNSYLSDLNNCPIAYSVHSWESVQLGAAMLKGEITGDWGNANELGKFQGNNYYFNNEWGSARHNATAQMCSLIAAKYNKADSSWAKGQMQYLTGDKAFANGQSHCLVVGFKSNSSKNPHHRAASPNADASKQNDGTPNANLLVGALCGGPLDANGTYQDIRSDYQGNEVACDYNAGLVGAAAGLYHFYKTGSIDTTIQGVTKIYSGSSSSVTPGNNTTITTTKPNPGSNVTTTTTPNPGTSTSDDDIVLEGSSLKAVKEESTVDGAINNVCEFAPQGAKSVTMYLKVNSNDTEVSGGFGTWTGEWEQEEFSGVKVNSDKTVAIDYTVPSNVGSTIKAMVWWPHDDDVTITKIVLHKGGSSSSNNTTKATTKATTTQPRVTTTTTPNPGTSTSSDDIVLEGSSLKAVKEESTVDGAINNVCEFAPQGAKSVTMYLKVNSNDTEVSGGFGTWTGEWEQEEFSGVKVNSDKTVAIDYTVPSNVGSTIKAMVWWPHDDDVTITKIVLHKSGSSSNNNTTTRATTTTTKATTTTTRATTTTTAPNKELDAKLLGDANCDNQVDLSDVVLIMQALANPNKYGINGSDRTHMTEQGQANADVHKRGNGVTSNDALAIQLKLLNVISSLPVDQV
ncbi:glycoside hydrolase family 9 protein [uncultured Ruminococcus sp.]|uniref:glycoside hydrolase family 9 protein n=1 Tax=uncultured Ruminococcus sp. TaxID=165186 RepID=UPI0025DACDB6|nr:glycoside hydrolase family 9 protein [uncultured Ruminococcus sp.]